MAALRAFVDEVGWLIEVFFVSLARAVVAGVTLFFIGGCFWFAWEIIVSLA